MNVQQATVSLTTTSGGAATVYSPVLSGRLLWVRVVLGTMTSGTFTFTHETNGEAIMAPAVSSTDTWYPNQQRTNATSGATVNAFDYNYIAAERIKCVVSSGGDTKTASIIFCWDGTDA